MSRPLIDTAFRNLDEHGFAVMENMIPADRAAQFAEKILAIPNPDEPLKGYRIVRELLNVDKEFGELMVHPALHEILHYLIGGRTEGAKNAFAWPAADRLRLSIVDGLVAQPGTEPGWWHVDPPMSQSVRQGTLLPDFPLVVNVFWILTPFRRETGATRLMPGSHRWRKMPPVTCEDLDGQQYLTAPAGSVAIIPSTTWHAPSKNHSDQDRVALASVFTPWWIGQFTRAARPIKQSMWKQLSVEAQALTKHQLHWPGDEAS